MAVPEPVDDPVEVGDRVASGEAPADKLLVSEGVPLAVLEAVVVPVRVLVPVGVPVGVRDEDAVGEPVPLLVAETEAVTEPVPVGE